MVKRLMVGRPLATDEQDHQRLPKWIGLPVFSSDAISSTAYATEEILFVTALGASSLTLGLSKLVPIAVAVAILLAIVTFSYRQTIFAYPSGGGSYIVSRENLGETPSLIAGASLLVDYVLTVAVSISAGVAAIVSIPTFQGLADQRVLMCLVLIAFITVANLRGAKESGKLFALPTYLYIVTLGGMLAIGLFQTYFGHIDKVPFDPERFEGARQIGGSLSLFLLLRGFSSGAVALSGVEAISNGVPAFRKPEAKNAATTLVWMAGILGTLFFGISVLAHHLEPYPTHEETVLSQMSRVVVGGGAYYWVLQFATAAILVLAANTAYADFPRLSSIIARDGYLPRQFSNRGDRLVFSNGVIFLAVAASGLIIAFGGITTALIPLYAIGVFTSFTLSQAGMVRHHLRLHEPGWRRGTIINGVGAVATGIVALIVGVTKFAIGAWVPIVVVPAIILVFRTIKRHYQQLGEALTITPDDVRRQDLRHTVVVLVGRVHRGVVTALNYAKSLRPDHLLALYVASDDEDRELMEAEWQRFRFDVPLEIVHSRYRDLVEPVERYLDELDQRWENDTITIIIPEVVVGTRSLANLLHGQSALALKLALIDRPATIVTSVPFLPNPPRENGAGREAAPPEKPPLAGTNAGASEVPTPPPAADRPTPVEE
jgi:amino acid transporter